MVHFLMFDLDGTLFDTAPGIASAFNNLLKERGEPPIPVATISQHIGYGLKELFSKLDSPLIQRLGDLDRLEADFHRNYRSTIVAESYLYPGLLEALREWPHELAVVSNKSEHYVRLLVASTPLRQFKWSSLIGGDSFHVKKPHPLPLQAAMRTVGAKPENSLMIGDGLPDVLAAREAGVKSIAISFGYTALSDLIQNGAHAAIHHYEELPKVIRSLSSN